MLYIGLRLGQATVTSKPVALHPEWVLVWALAVASGASVYLAARSPCERTLGILLAAAPAILAALFGFGVVAAMNLLVFAPRVGAGIYNYALGTLALLASLMEIGVFHIAFRLVARFWPQGPDATLPASEFCSE